MICRSALPVSSESFVPSTTRCVDSRIRPVICLAASLLRSAS
jgi:hypothetical protein